MLTTSSKMVTAPTPGTDICQPYSVQPEQTPGGSHIDLGPSVGGSVHQLALSSFAWK